MVSKRLLQFVLMKYHLCSTPWCIERHFKPDRFSLRKISEGIQIKMEGGGTADFKRHVVNIARLVTDMNMRHNRELIENNVVGIGK